MAIVIAMSAYGRFRLKLGSLDIARHWDITCITDINYVVGPLDVRFLAFIDFFRFLYLGNFCAS